MHLKFELLDTLLLVVLLRPHKNTDKLLCTTHSLEYLVSEETEAWKKSSCLFLNLTCLPLH